MPVDPRMKNPHEPTSWFESMRKQRGWGYPDIFTIKGSVLPSCIPIIFFSTLLAAVVAVLYEIYEYNITLPGSLVGTVAVVVGLLLAFRTNNAYDRYYEGRKLFTSMCTQIRNATRALWVGVVETTEEDRFEKEKNINLLLAFAVAVKHHLRLEFGTEWFDLQDLLPDGFQLTYFGGNATQENTDVGGGGPDDPNRPENALSDNQPIPPNETTALLNHNRRPAATRIPPTIYTNLRNSISANELAIWFGDDNLPDEVDASMSLPLEIVFHLGLYIDAKMREGKLDGSRYGSVSFNLNALVEILGSLERIGDTPTPFAYNVHLKQAVTLYVWVIPFTLIAELGWVTIPAVMFISFILFGVEAIGAEIENPFGYDKNDLPLDEYCKDLEAEVNYLQRHLPSKIAIGAQ